MNANELADLMDKVESVIDAIPLMDKAATMLRQQQAEIEALKGEVAHLKHINKNWSISEGWALKEIEALKSERDLILEFVKSRGEVGQLIVYKALLEAQEK